MAAAYTQRKVDIESGAANKATSLIAALDVTPLLKAADDDASAYADLQRTWKEGDTMPPEEKAAIEARALQIPISLLESCHAQILHIHEFLPFCNKNITSDAKVGMHQLAGAARAAYQVRGGEKRSNYVCSWLSFTPYHESNSNELSLLSLDCSSKFST